MWLKTTVAFELRKGTATTSGSITSFYTLRTSRNKNSCYVRREVINRHRVVTHSLLKNVSVWQTLKLSVTY